VLHPFSSPSEARPHKKTEKARSNFAQITKISMTFQERFQLLASFTLHNFVGLELMKISIID
jgi:hypothetical protein